MKIDLKLKTYEQLQDEVIKLLTNNYLKDSKIEQLQSNWNSLREYIGKEWYCFDNESVEHEVAKNILDKMNELEGKDKE